MASNDDLPPNWEAVTDDAGEVYYWNTVTDETSWEKPVVDNPLADQPSQTPKPPEVDGTTPPRNDPVEPDHESEHSQAESDKETQAPTEKQKKKKEKKEKKVEKKSQKEPLPELPQSLTPEKGKLLTQLFMLPLTYSSQNLVTWILVFILRLLWTVLCIVIGFIYAQTYVRDFDPLNLTQLKINAFFGVYLIVDGFISALWVVASSIITFSLGIGSIDNGSQFGDITGFPNAIIPEKSILMFLRVIISLGIKIFQAVWSLVVLIVLGVSVPVAKVVELTIHDVSIQFYVIAINALLSIGSAGTSLFLAYILPQLKSLV